VALNLGELVAFLRLDDTDFERRAAKAPKTLAGQAAPAEQAGKKVGDSFAGGAEQGTRNLPKHVGEQIRRADAESVGPAKKAGEKIGEKIKDGTKEQLAGLAGIIGGSLAGLGIGEAVGGLFERGNVTGRLAAQLGLAKPAAAAAGTAAAQIYAQNFGDNLDEVGEAVRAVAQQLPDLAGVAFNAPKFQDAAKRVLTIASTFGLEAQEIAVAAGQLVTTGLAKNSAQAFDLITRAEQKGIDKSGDFLDNLNEYAVQFRRLGLSGTEAFGLVQQGLRGGARDADTVADALKEFAIRAVDGTTTTAAAFRALHLPVQQTIEAFAKGGPAARKSFGEVVARLKAIKDPAVQSQLAVALFGTKSEDAAQALLHLDLNTAARGMGNLAGATDRAGQALGDTAGAKLETFKRGMQTKLVDFLGGTAIPKLQEFGRWTQQNASWLLPLAGAVTAGAVAWKAYGLAQDIATFATKLFNNEIRLSPLGIALTLLVALGVGLYLLWQKSETFRRIVHGAISAVAGVFRVLGHDVAVAFGWLDKTIRIAGAIGHAVGSVIGGAWGKTSSVIGEANRKLTEFLGLSEQLVPIGGIITGIVQHAAQGPGTRGKAYAAGGRFGPGLALVGEHGPELALFDRPGLMLTASQTRAVTSPAGGSVPLPGAAAPVMVGEVHVWIGDRELTDIVRVEVRASNRQTTAAAVAGTGRRR
jgi:hypothetical protein